LGIQLPEEITGVTMGFHELYDFSEDVSLSVAVAIPKAVRIIRDLLLEYDQVYIPDPDHPAK